MNCPKCTDRHGNPTKMMRQSTLSCGSTMNGQLSETNVVDGYSCPSCAKWINAVIKPTCPKPPKFEGYVYLKDRVRIHPHTAVDDLVWKFRDSIQELQAKGADVQSVICLIRKVGGLPRLPNKSALASLSRLARGILHD